MKEVLQFALLGLGAGAVYALLAQGVVLIFRGSGILNLAHGAFAMVGAYMFDHWHTGQGWPLMPAMVASIAMVMIVGLLTDQVLMRRLRRSSPLARLIGTLGVLIVIQSVGILVWGGTPTLVYPVIEPQPVTILGATVTSDRLWMLAIAVIVTGVLTALWRLTRIGWITEAVSENQRSAAALGWAPEVVSAATWAAGAGLAALAGILVAPITGLSVSNLTLIVIAALAAALIGDFRSFPLTLLGGVAIGIAQSEVGNYVDVPGAAEAIPFVVIVVFLVVTGSSLPLRGHIFDRLPAVGIGRVDPRVLVGVLSVGVLLLSLVSDRDWLQAFSATFAVGVILLSLVVLIGYAGQLSLAQYALAGVGALTAARLMATQGWSFEFALLAGVLVAMLVGLVFALPALRTRGVNLAVVTLGLGLATQALVFNNSEYTGGDSGTAVDSPHVFGINVDPYDHANAYTILVFVLFVLSGVAVANLRRGRTGRRLLAMRANERAAVACGINVFAAKLHAFAVAGALAGLGGVLLGFQSTNITFDRFGPLASIDAVAEAVVGGVGFVAGALLGAGLSPGSFGSLVTLNWQGFNDYLPLVGGALLLITLVVHPNGIAGTLSGPLGRLREKVPPRLTATVPGLEVVAPSRVAPMTLTVEGLTVRYGRVVAVDTVSLQVSPGEVVALIGPNGAGKTSLMDAVTGFSGYTGRVRLEDTPIDSWSASRRARAGMVRSFQGLELFEDLTVLENIQAASDRRDAASLITDLVRPGRSELPSAAAAAIREFGLAESLDRLPDELPYGQRRLVAIARAVAMEPSVLLLDEPVAGLDDQESGEFARLVRRLAEAWGMAVLVIDHDMDFVMDISDRIVVMDFGKHIAEGTPAEVQRSPAAIAAYLGEESEALPEGDAGLPLATQPRAVKA